MSSWSQLAAWFRSIVVLGALCSVAGTGCDPVKERLYGVDGIDAEDVQGLQASGVDLLLVDTRSEADFVAGHVPGAVRLPLDGIDGYLERADLARDPVVVTICRHGNESLGAAAAVAAHGYRQVYSLRGGMARWTELGLPIEAGPGPAVDSELLGRPVRDANLAAALAIVVAAFGLKPLYMLLSFLLILWLRRQTSRDLVLIRRGLIAFLAGEGFCAANYLIAADTCTELELVHGLGMVLMGIWLSQGLFALADHRVVRFSEPQLGCLLQRFCGRCGKRDPVACGLRRLLHFAVPALALLALLPLTLPLRPTNLTLLVFGDEVYRDKTVLVMMLEFRIYPVLAALALALAAIRLRGGADAIRRAELPLFVGVGLMAFSLFRCLLYFTFRDMPLWSDWWEELTEFFTIFGLAWLLFVFRNQLGLALPWRATGPGAESPDEAV